ncbi:MAG: hypothetical protein HY980_04495 [Candidatus Magasanikbacteria bacterium]|nr:hypothetical protein [Candidatus Magasanikbacteria bacterium]
MEKTEKKSKIKPYMIVVSCVVVVLIAIAAKFPFWRINIQQAPVDPLAVKLSPWFFFI